MTNNADQPTSHQVADFFLANRDDEDGLTHLKLQKLCYYAQVFHLALIGRRLFDEQLLAWDHGPVTRSIWDRFAYQRGVLPRPEDFDSTSLSADTLSFLGRIYREYGQYSAWRLREMTHKEEPWIEGYADNGVVKDETMRRFFKAQLDSRGQEPQPLSLDDVRTLVGQADVQARIERSRSDFASGAYREA